MPFRVSIAGLLCGALFLTPLAVGARAHHTPPKQLSAEQSQPATAAQQRTASQQAPAIPPPPPTPEEMPATPPKVAMNGGELSIVADNSTLGDVLNAVKRVTGASLEVPGSVGAERIAVNLGPGQPQQVLQQLFAGSRFDYIILGSPSNASAVDKIILTARGAAAGAPNTAGNQPPREASQPQLSPDQGDDDEASQQPEPPPQQQEEAQPQQIGPGGEAAAQENNNQPKSPEQLLQELQRMQQQQQGRPPRVQPQ